MSTETTTQTMTADTERLRDRVVTNPRPALLWILGLVVLIIPEFGALMQVVVEILMVLVRAIPGDPGIEGFIGLADTAARIPTLLSPELISNQGYYNGQQWVNTFLGFEPMFAWLFRVVLIYAYSFLWLVWFWVGYQWFREHYRYADWTPRDDIIDRLRGHRWGQFGFIIVFMFVVMAVFAPSLGPTTFEQNIYNPYGHTIKYYDTASNAVQTITAGAANGQSISNGGPEVNVGIWQYDNFNRFHPFGTLPSGSDLFTFLAYGARISLFIALSSIGIAAAIALLLSLVTAYYKGLTDIILVFASDTVQALPLLLLAIMAAVVFGNHWIAQKYDGAILLIGLFSLVYWPFFWRAIRGPAFQISEETWIDAARSYGQRPLKIMEKHMAPYVIGYLLIYGSMSIGGIIILTSALSYLGFGIVPPTPEWGRAVSAGQVHIGTVSWHISTIPGILITLVVVGFNALGDGIRDAIDPESGGEEGGTEAAAVSGGGG